MKIKLLPIGGMALVAVLVSMLTLNVTSAQNVPSNILPAGTQIIPEIQHPSFWFVPESREVLA